MRKTLFVLLLTLTVAFIIVPRTYAAGPCPGDPDCPTPTPTPRVCDNLDWYCLRECASSATREVFGGNSQLWRQQKIEFTNRDNGTNYTSCTQAGPITPSPSLGISPTASAPSASPRPTAQITVTPSLGPDMGRDCSATGWETRFAWARPADYTDHDYVFSLDHQGSIGADFQKELTNTSELIVDTLPRQAYTAVVKKQLSDTSPLYSFPIFTCIPQSRTTSTAPCFKDGQKNAQCTVDLWAKDMNESNNGNMANEILAPSTDADLNSTIDLLDFERIRAATHD